MSLIDLASLVLAPTAVKDGKVYNAIPNDQDFTFSRGTEATRVNSAGLIEKARTNLLLQSNTFDTTWGDFNGASGQAGYDGTNNAWRYDSSSSVLRLQQVGLSFSGVHTYSIYAKYVDAQWFSLQIAGSTNESAWFNIQNGTLGSTSSAVDSSITSVGGGWYRCSVTGSASNQNRVRLYVVGSDGSLSNITASLLIQDAQLEVGLVATEYIDTTTSSVTVGITDDLPRVDYSGGGCPSLLLEPQRSNLMVQSEAFSTSAWILSNANVTANATISPEGVQNASEIEFTTTSSEIYDQFTNVASSLHIGSIFVKNDDINSIKFEVVGGAPNIDASVVINLANGTLSNQVGDYTPTIEEYGNDWYRVSIGDTSNATIATPSFRLKSDGTNTGSFYAYGAMLEAGSYVSSYLPSYGTSTSRSADSCSLTNASNLIGQSEGTLFVEFELDKVNLPNNHTWIATKDSSQTNRILVYMLTNESTLRGQIKHSGTAINFNFGTISDGQNIKIAIAYKSGDSVVYINGSSVVTNTNTLTFGTMDRFSFNDASTSVEGDVNQAILFPTRLTNDQLAEITK